MTRRILGIVGVPVCLMLLGASFAAAGKPQPNGSFTGAGFTPPDFADRDNAVVPVGESRLFTAVCSCAQQPGTAPCYGSVILDMEHELQWAVVGSDTCAADEGATCSASFGHAFDTEGTFRFRVRCDEDDGTDAVQNPADGVTITVEAATSACTSGESRPCPLQDGVCAGSTQACVEGEWQACEYGAWSADFQDPEAGCDGLDNDCDGRVDFVDLDEDGVGVCGGPGVVNELFLTDVELNLLEVYEYRNGSYESVWSTYPTETTGTGAGGEAGDLTGDGVPEIALQRLIEGTANRLEVWTFDAVRAGWYRLWAGPEEFGSSFKIGDIVDADGDGVNELLVSDRNNHQLVLYAWNGSGFAVEAVVQECPNERGALFIATSGDINGDGTPEILFQCDTPDPISIRQYADGGYPVVGSVPVPLNLGGFPMIVDDMETGDVNRDGRADAVFCGNSGQVHVLTWRDGAYSIDFSSPPPSADNVFSQTCSAGDVTNDGFDDIVVVNSETVRVFTHDGTGYVPLWSDGPTGITPGLGSSFIGDADNDGRGEFLWGRPLGAGYHLHESDEVPATDFSVTAAFGTMYGGRTVIVGNLNPTNDEAPADCDDADPFSGALEVCGDGLDNDCDTEVDEGCDISYCGDNVRGGSAVGESCTTCPDDCGCLGPGCRHGCCGDGACGKLENADNCPVDCS